MYQLKRLPIHLFIKNFKIQFNENELIKVFTQGYCYHFAVILKNIYNEGRIVYSNSMGHFLLKYKNKYYDITGCVKVKDAIDFDTLYYTDSALYNKLMRDCVLKIQYYPYDDNEWCKKI
jgi:hypothetical protein